MIRIDGVSHHIHGKEILSNITLEIPKGGVTALVGPNGAGKSTLLSVVSRLVPLQTGRISVDGLDITATPTRQMAQTLSILPQTAEAAPRLTVRELIGFGRYPYHQGRPGPEDHARVDRAIGTFDLGALAERPLDSLSGGQRQRAQVAMIYAQDTDYLLLDEPLNNLDIAASRSLMAELRRLARDHGRTIVIVLHDINYASAYADRIVVLKGGRLARQGTPEQIIDESLLGDVFGTDATVLRHDGRPFVLT